MVSQAKGGCSECGSMFHTKMYHKPRKPIKRSAIKTGSKLGSKSGSNSKAKPRSYYVKKLDLIFSRYIRLSYADKYGNTTCVTCGNVKPYQQHQNGHYESRGHIPTRWAEDNCHVQCLACNLFKKGNYTEYAIYMINRYGADKLIDLRQRARSGVKISTQEIKEMTELYRGKIEKLKENRR